MFGAGGAAGGRGRRGREAAAAAAGRPEGPRRAAAPSMALVERASSGLNCASARGGSSRRARPRRRPRCCGRTRTSRCRSRGGRRDGLITTSGATPARARRRAPAASRPAARQRPAARPGPAGPLGGAHRDPVMGGAVGASGVPTPRGSSERVSDRRPCGLVRHRITRPRVGRNRRRRGPVRQAPVLPRSRAGRRRRPCTEWWRRAREACATIDPMGCRAGGCMGCPWGPEVGTASRRRPGRACAGAGVRECGVS